MTKDADKIPVSENCAPELSIVIPMHNAENELAALFARVTPIAEKITQSHEIICVDDGSTDGTLAALLELRQLDGRFKVVELSREFGRDAALTAGLDHASGDAVVSLDANLQDPPEVIERLHTKWQEGFDVVYAQASTPSGGGFARRIMTVLFSWVSGAAADVDYRRDRCEFQLMDRKVINALRRMPERSRFRRGAFGWVGFRQASVPYRRDLPVAKDSRGDRRKVWNTVFDGVVSGRTVPLRFWTWVGGSIIAVALVCAAVLMGSTLFHGTGVPGHASVLVAVLLLGGVNILALGILGQHLHRVFAEIQHRPLYLVNRNHGIVPAERAEPSWTRKSATP